MLPELVGEGVGELRLPEHHVAEEGGEDLGEEGEEVGVVAYVGGHGGADGGAVHQRQAFLGLQLERAGVDAGDLERLRGADLFRRRVSTPAM